MSQTSFQASQVFPAKAGVHSGGTAYFRYNGHRNSGVIVKPLIVAKGYDMSDVAPSLVNHYTFQNFLYDLNLIGPQYDLSGNLDQAGYDIVFLDYNQGTDDIVRNAALLQDVITWVNTQKAQANSVEQNVVLGISMGGLVSRYCLANMTKQNLNHQTRLLLTDDSPHQGANVPLGIQFLTRAANETVIGNALSLFDIVPQLKQAVAALDAPASQQMLILHATNGTGAYSSNTFLNTTYRNMITFSPGGPQPTYRTEAISLGSECGVRSAAPGVQLFSESGGFTLGTLYVYSEGMYINSFANALPAYGTTTTISQLHIWVNVTILYVISVSQDLTNKTATSPPNSLPWDGAPGGILSTQDQVSISLPSVSHNWIVFSFSSSPHYAKSFAFVPTVSALDVTTINSTALSASYVGGVSPTNLSRVSNFIAEGAYDDPNGNFYNGTHAELTPRNAEWLFYEMEPALAIQADPNVAKLNCSQDCTTSYAGLLTGPSPLCNNGNFVINNLPASSSVVWTSSNSAMLSINASGNATQSGGNHGSETVSAAITGNCASTFTVSILYGWATLLFIPFILMVG